MKRQTNVLLDEELFIRAKSFAVKQKISFSEAVELGLRLLLRERGE